MNQTNNISNLEISDRSNRSLENSAVAQRWKRHLRQPSMLELVDRIFNSQLEYTKLFRADRPVQPDISESEQILCIQSAYISLIQDITNTKNSTQKIHEEKSKEIQKASRSFYDEWIVHLNQQHQKGLERVRHAFRSTLAGKVTDMMKKYAKERNAKAALLIKEYEDEIKRKKDRVKYLKIQLFYCNERKNYILKTMAQLQEVFNRHDIREPDTFMLEVEGESVRNDEVILFYKKKILDFEQNLATAKSTLEIARKKQTVAGRISLARESIMKKQITTAVPHVKVCKYKTCSELIESAQAKPYWVAESAQQITATENLPNPEAELHKKYADIIKELQDKNNLSVEELLERQKAQDKTFEELYDKLQMAEQDKSVEAKILKTKEIVLSATSNIFTVQKFGSRNRAIQCDEVFLNQSKAI